jgi:hypothetical protein
MTTRRIALAALLLSLSTLFCTLRPSGGAPGGSSGPISDDERIATLDAISEVVEGSTLPDGEVDRAALLKYFESNPQFEGSGEAPDGSVWARFTDGRLVIIPPPIPEASEEEATPAPSSDATSPDLSYAPPTVAVSASPEGAQEGKAVSRMRQQGGEQANLPASDVAIVMDSLGSGFADFTVALETWLNDKGYSARIEDPTVEKLKAVRDVGVFYFGTHGGQGCLGTFQACEAAETPEAPPTQTAYTYALWTLTPVNELNEAPYKADLDAKYLAYMLADSGDKKPDEWRYAITGEFVSTYMEFSNDSLVFIDACSSLGAGSTLPTALQQAHAAEAWGWTAPTSSGDAPLYFFDRMLGINKSPYKGTPKKPNPPNRPFDMAAVVQHMDSVGSRAVGNSSGGIAYLAGRRLQGQFGILRPTIERLVVNEEKNELEIYGVFGDSWGRVTINDTEVIVKEDGWSSKKIIVELPDADKPGGAGNVVVWVRKHKSNPVPLTLWHGKFTYTEGPEMIGGTWTMVYDLYLRADVHRYRTQPDTDPLDHKSGPIEAADGSTAQWQCDWTGGLSGVSVSAGSSGKIPLDRDGSADAGFMVRGELVPKDHTIEDLSFPTKTAPETICPTHVTGPTVSYDTYTDFLFLSVLEAEPEPPILEVKLDDTTWQMTKDKRALVLQGDWPWLEWQNIKPEYAPDPKKTDA